MRKSSWISKEESALGLWSWGKVDVRMWCNETPTVDVRGRSALSTPVEWGRAGSMLSVELGTSSDGGEATG